MAVNYVSPIIMTSINVGTLSGGYDVVNTGLTNPCFMLRIVNDSSEDIEISFDGVVSHDYLVWGNTLQIYAQANAQPNGYVANFRKGQPIYVKGAAGQGYIYVAAYYSRQ